MLGAGFTQASGGADATPMPQTRAGVAQLGLTALNFFAHSPICCPSRAQLLTGRYFHNLRVRPSEPLADAREDCMHVDGRRVNNRSFALALQAVGYQTAYIGKYLNRWPKSYVPLGFDAFLGSAGCLILPQDCAELWQAFCSITPSFQTTRCAQRCI